MQLAAQGLGETDISVPWEVRVLIFLRHKLLYGICDNIEWDVRTRQFSD